MSADTGAGDWIGRSNIATIEYALKPGAYVARAYHFQKKHGELPDWARKGDGGQWLFRRRYIEGDAWENAHTISVSDAARMIGATRRAVQTWVDEGIVVSLDSDREEGKTRRIDRDAFERDLPRLKARLRSRATEASDSPAASPAINSTQVDRLKRELESAGLARKAAERQQARASHDLEREEEARKDLAAARRDVKRDLGGRLRSLERKLERAEEHRAAAAKRAREQACRLEEASRKEAELARAVEEAELMLSRALAEEADRTTGQGAARGGDDERLRSAAFVAERFRRARSERLEADEKRREGKQIAERIAADVDAGTMERVDAAILFNDVAGRAGIPDDIRIELMRDYFRK